MRFAVGVFVVVSLAAVERPVQAQPEEDAAAEAYARGRAHYRLGEYERAIDAFREAYRLSERPALLFNIAQSYRLAGDCATAVAFYERYLRLEDPAELRAETPELLDETKACAERQAVETEDQGQRDVATTDTPPPDERVVAPPPVDDDRRARGRRPGLWVGLGVTVAGVATLGGSLALALDARAIESDLEDRTDPWTDDELARFDEGDDRARLARVFAATGGAVTAAGAFLMIWYRGESGGRVDAVTIAPAADGAGVGAIVRGRW